MPFAYPYIRFSSDNQKDGSSLLRQTQAIQRYLIENPHLAVDKSLNLEDLGKSGFEGRHIEKGGALFLFLEKIKKNEIEKGSVLIIEHFNRLSRLPLIKSITLFNEILASGIHIAVLEEKQTFTAESLTSMDYLKAVLRFEVAHQESKDKSNKGLDNWRLKKDALREASDPIKARLEFTRTVPLWLKVKDEEIQIDEQKAKTINLIFELCSTHNYGFMKVGRYLNESGVQRLDGSNGPWTFDIIKRLVHNRALIGEYQPRKSIKKEGRKRLEYVPSDELPIQNVFPVVVDLDLFNQVQVKTQARKITGGGRRAQMPNLFVKLLRCSECGGSVKHQKHNNGYKDYRYLKCYNSLYGHCVSVGNRAWRYDEFEEIFFDYAGKLNLDEIFSDVSGAAEVVKSEILSLELKRSAAEVKIGEITKQILSAEIVSVSYNSILVTLERDMANLSTKIQVKHQELSVLRGGSLASQKEAFSSSNKLVQESRESVELREKINSQLREVIFSIEIDFTDKCVDIKFKNGVIRSFHTGGVYADIPPRVTGEQREKEVLEFEEWFTLTTEEKREKEKQAGFQIVPMPVTPAEL